MSDPRPIPATEPDDGPLIETGPSEIEIEREQAGVEEDDAGHPAVPPELERAPD